MAGNRIKGITVEIGGDTTKLQTALKGVNGQIKSTQQQLADAMNYMAMAGWKTEDMLSGIEGVMYLAAASGEDLATTSDIVTDALTAFGLTAGELLQE